MNTLSLNFDAWFKKIFLGEWVVDGPVFDEFNSTGFVLRDVGPR